VILEVHDDVYEAVGHVAGKRLSSPLEGRDPVFDAEGLTAASRHVELVDERGVRLSVLEKHRYLLSGEAALVRKCVVDGDLDPSPGRHVPRVPTAFVGEGRDVGNGRDPVDQDAGDRVLQAELRLFASDRLDAIRSANGGTNSLTESTSSGCSCCSAMIRMTPAMA